MRLGLAGFLLLFSLVHCFFAYLFGLIAVAQSSNLAWAFCAGEVMSVVVSFAGAAYLLCEVEEE